MARVRRGPGDPPGLLLYDSAAHDGALAVYRAGAHCPETSNVQPRWMAGTSTTSSGSKRFYDAVLAVLAGEPVRNAAKTGHLRLFYRHGGAVKSSASRNRSTAESATAANGIDRVQVRFARAGPPLPRRCGGPWRPVHRGAAGPGAGGQARRAPSGLRAGPGRPCRALYRPG
ncbi:MAG: hypothetical protein MZW92_23800 [Comamonadaceae bacterium]|nr:hypothetical protein [Comamonadaceae bacterium]